MRFVQVDIYSIGSHSHAKDNSTDYEILITLIGILASAVGADQTDQSETLYILKLIGLWTFDLGIKGHDVIQLAVVSGSLSDVIVVFT